MNQKNNARRICAGLFLVYGLIMIYLLFLQRTPSWDRYWDVVSQSYNLQPMKTVSQMMGLLHSRPALARFAIINLIGNVVMFIPLGLLPAIWQRQRKFGWYALTVSIVILLIELLQLFTTLGSADVDDFLFNLLGALIGFGIWRTVCSICRLNQ